MDGAKGINGQYANKGWICIDGDGDGDGDEDDGMG